MANWRITEGRVIIFPISAPSNPQPNALEQFRQVWGVDPDQFQRSNSNALMPSTAQATRNGASLSCVVHPSRIDFTIGAPVPPLGPIQGRMLQVASGELFFKELERLILAMGSAEKRGDANRVALNVQLHSQEPTIREANQVLLQALPEDYKIQLADEEDFIFQVNRPYVSTTANIKMNDMTRWSMDRIRVLNFAMGVGNTSANAFKLPSTQDFNAAGLLIDVNSIPTQAILVPTQQGALLHEAATHAKAKLQELKIKVGGMTH